MTQHQRRCATFLLTLACLLVAYRDTRGAVVAYWRFEDVTPGTKLDASLGSTEPPFSTTASDGATVNRLRTFNTRADRVPPDTSGTFIASADLPPLASGMKNAQSARFVGNQDFYTWNGDGGDAPIDALPLRQFTIEGLFKLDALSGQIGDRYQCVVGKDGKPIERLGFQPFVVVVAGRDDQYMSRDCLSVNLIDASGTYRTAASRKPLHSGQWYAFAATCDGATLNLFLNRFDGNGYQLEASVPVEGGLIETAGTWTIGRGMYDRGPNSWLQGSADEIRISDEVLPGSRFLTSSIRTLAEQKHPANEQPPPRRCVDDVADPAVLLHDGVYYLYGTSDTRGFDVWTSSDLRQWDKAGRAIEAGLDVWGDGAFWAPAVLEHRGKFYLFYSASGILPDTGGLRSVRMCVAVADSPLGPFREVVARMPLIGRAVIDPEVFIDDDGTPYLYFVADTSENNGAGQIYVVKMTDDLLGTIGEPVPCISPSQPWEGTVWNEGPVLLKQGDTYVMMYSGNFWGSHDYAVGFATAPSPLGPWDKFDANPILHRYAGLLGTGHNSIVRAPDGKSWLTFFHAHRGPRDARRDTYVAALTIDTDRRGTPVPRLSALPE